MTSIEDITPIQNLVELAEKDPLTVSTVETHTIDPETYTNIKHQLDIRLRKAVNTLAETMKPKMRAVNQKRKEWLQSVDYLGDELSEADLETALNQIADAFIRECKGTLSYVSYKQPST